MNVTIVSLFIIVFLILIYFFINHTGPNININEAFKEYHNYFNTSNNIINTSNTPILKNKIFVSIASYRDPECKRTVLSLINNAMNPNDINIHVYEQNDPKDTSVSSLNVGNCNVVTHHYNKAMGPTWARYLIQQKWEGEEFVLQIDSHTVFIKNWDYILKEMLNLLPKKSVLTQYPPEYELNTGKYNTNILRSELYVEGFKEIDKFTRIQSEYHKGVFPSQPFISEAWSACFSFSNWEIIRDAPYDPSLPYLFFGEELDITTRLYTRGWNFYSPNISIVFTNFKRTHRPTIWKDHETKKRKKIELLSRARLYHRLGMNKELDKLNINDNTKLLFNNQLVKLGTERSLKDYEDFAGIDIENQTVKDHNRKRIIDINRPKQLWMNNIMFWEHYININ